MSREDGGSAADKARELDRIGREAMRDGRSEGGLSEADLRNLEQSAQLEDYQRREREAFQRDRQEKGPGSAPAPTGSISDDLDITTSSRGVMGLDPNRRAPRAEDRTERGLRESDLSALEREERRRDLTALLNALKKPENLTRLGGASLALIGAILLALAFLRAEANQVPGAVVASPTLAAATGGPAVTTAPTPIPTAARPTTPLSAGPVVATQTGTVTSYIVEDLKGDGLRYDWRHSATCASHSGESTATYSWDHPHPPCPDEPFHTSFITVQITDASGQALVRQYTLGSRPGRGQVPAGGGVFTPQTPSPTVVALSPTPFPTTTTRPATGTPAPTASPATGTAGGPNVPLALFGGLLTLGGLGVAWRGPVIFGGPRIRKEAPKDPCEREKAAEAAARARLAAARSRFDRIDALTDSSRKAQQESEAKARAAEEAKRGASYAESNGVRVYTNKQKGQQIAAADAAATAAREAAARAKAACDAAGGQAEWTAAQDERYKANRDWELANESLQRCLQLFAPPPPPPPPPPTTGGTTTGGTTFGGGPVVATGGSTQTMERRCTEGEVKAGSERTTTREITVNELNRAEIVLDAIYPGAQSTSVTEFIDWMDFIRRSFKAGKAINTLVDGKLVEGTLDTIDATELQDIPDFTTYWDKLTEATLKGLKQTTDIFIDRFGKLGGYSLKYTRRTHTATCRTWEECANGTWVRKREVKVEITRTDRGRMTRTIDVHDKSEIAPAIDRLFTELGRENERGTSALKAFEEACGH